MLAKAKGLGHALRLGALMLAGVASSVTHAQGMVGTLPVRSTTPTGAPTISGNPTRMLVAGTFYDFRPAASDPNGDRLNFSINKLPRWATFDATSGRISGTPVTSDVGRIKGIKVTVTDGVNTKSLTAFSIKVVAGKPPQIHGAPPKDATEGQPYDFLPAASDSDLQALRYGIINKPTWASFDTATGRLTGTPPKGSAGTYANVGISVTDGASTTSLATFAINVAPVPNTAPRISGTPPASVQVGQVFDFTPAASDADGDALRYAVVNKPTWANFDGTTGRLSGKPATGSEGTYADVVISVGDGTGISFLAPFAINVTTAPVNKTPAPNSAPSIGGTAPSGVVEGGAYTFQPSSSDADGDALAFSAANLPNWLTINPGTGRLAGTAPAGSAGTYSGIVVTVSDGKAAVALPAFSLVVTTGSNSAPAISGMPATGVMAGDYYSFRPSATDANGDTLTFGVANKPAWLTFNAATGELAGGASDSDAGTHSNIRITVFDGKVATGLPAFSITVIASSVGNRSPSISGSPATTAKEGVAYSFTPSATDPDGQALRFGIANLPSWASFDTVTGRLSGTPAAGTAGSYSNIVISVSDGSASAFLPAFSLTVAAASTPNRTPSISGTPSTSVDAGQVYAFVPTATDPDGDALAFGIANKPDWASFDITTGRLSGTPASGDVGSYPNVVISVSDGTASATLPAFGITVQAPAVGSAQLTWVAPTQNEDGSALTNLAGFKVRYGTSPSSMSKVVDIPNPGMTSATIEGLGVGTWYFAAIAYTNTGVESAPSAAASKTIL